MSQMSYFSVLPRNLCKGKAYYFYLTCQERANSNPMIAFLGKVIHKCFQIVQVEDKHSSVLQGPALSADKYFLHFHVA